MMSFGCHIVASGSSSLRVCKISTTVCGFSELCNHDIPTMTMTMITTIIPTWLLRTRSLSFQWSWELPTRAVCNWPARAQGLGGWNVDVACLRWMTLKISIGIRIYTLDFSYLHIYIYIYYEYIYIYIYICIHTRTYTHYMHAQAAATLKTLRDEEQNMLSGRSEYSIYNWQPISRTQFENAMYERIGCVNSRDFWLPGKQVANEFPPNLSLIILFVLPMWGKCSASKETPSGTLVEPSGTPFFGGCFELELSLGWCSGVFSGGRGATGGESWGGLMLCQLM